MSTNDYDVIVVGARCAGSPMAMLLSRQGFNVLVVDKATFPSDTISTHLIHPPGVAALSRWGLLDRVLLTGCPPVDTYAFDFGSFTLTGSPAIEEARAPYAPRRTVLDKLLLDAAVEAGAEVREGFTVDEIVMSDGRVAGIRGHEKGGRSVVDRARVVVGADGRHSMLAEAVRAEQYNEKPKLLAAYYTYYRNLPINGRFETYELPRRGIAAWPTNDDLTLVIAGWPFAEFDANRKDIAGNMQKTLDMAPEFAERIRAATREERFAGAAVLNYFRKPFGPGWALVGDAGYNKDFITAQGIQDAFLDAELCVSALADDFSGRNSFEKGMANYQSQRDERVLAMYEFTCDLATLEPAPPETQQLFAAMQGNQEAMDGFARVMAGATSPAEFFAPENIEKIIAVAA